MDILLFCQCCSKDLERKVDWQGISDAPTTCENKVQVTAWCKALLEEKKKNSVLQCVESFPNGESYFRKFILGKRKLFQGSGNIGLHITKGCFPKQSRIILLILLFSIYPTSLGQKENVWKRLENTTWLTAHMSACG